MESTLAQRAKRTGKKILRILVITLLVVGAGVFSFYYWGVYEHGVMAGKVLRISKKGMVFKTYEGKINLETFGALKGASPVAEAFDFSVEKSDEAVIKRLEEVSLSGERVNLHFVKRYAIFPWRGDTRYFATKIERADPKPN
jgi:hypothetical protein